MQDIGFHHKATNQHLARFFPKLELPPFARVLVPLCGKSNDMLWLMQQGYHVIGIELCEEAVKAFFEENNLGFRCEYQEKVTIYHAPQVTIYQGDLFEMLDALIMPCDGYYDRAALVALLVSRRAQYAKKIVAWLAANAQGLLIAYTYEYPEVIGPPYSVPQNEVEKLYHGAGIKRDYDGPLLHGSKLNHYPIKILSEQVYQLTW